MPLVWSARATDCARACDSRSATCWRMKYRSALSLKLTVTWLKPSRATQAVTLPSALAKRKIRSAGAPGSASFAAAALLVAAEIVVLFAGVLSRYVFHSPIVWSEIAASPIREDELTVALSWLDMARESIPFEAAFRAGKAHRAYRLAGGQRERTLPDFLIGAHAEWRHHRLLTRDAPRYRSYFPTLDILSPETHP